MISLSRGAALRLRKWSDWANRVTEASLFVIGFGMALLTGIQVFSRYVLNHSLFWSEEVGRICLVWISFLGASAAYKRRVHIGIDFFVARLPRALRRAIEVAILCFSLVFFSVLILFGSKFALFISGQKTAALSLPVSLTYMVIPVSGGLFFLHGLSHLFDTLGADTGDQ